MECGEVGCGEAVVSGCYAPEVLQPAEHALDGVAASVECGAKAALLTPVCLGRDIRHRGAGFEGASEAICIEGTVGDHQGAFGNRLDQRLAAAEIRRVTTGEMELDCRAGRVCRGVDLGGPAATQGAPSQPAAMGSPQPPDGLRAPPSFPPEALRCAFA